MRDASLRRVLLLVALARVASAGIPFRIPGSSGRRDDDPPPPPIERLYASKPQRLVASGNGPGMGRLGRLVSASVATLDALPPAVRVGGIGLVAGFSKRRVLADAMKWLLQRGRGGEGGGDSPPDRATDSDESPGLVYQAGFGDLQRSRGGVEGEACEIDRRGRLCGAYSGKASDLYMHATAACRFTALPRL